MPIRLLRFAQSLRAGSAPPGERQQQSGNQAISHWPLAVSERSLRPCTYSQLIRGEINATVNSFWTRSPQRQARVWPKSPRPRADGERSLIISIQHSAISIQITPIGQNRAARGPRIQPPEQAVCKRVNSERERVHRTPGNRQNQRRG